MVWGCFLQPRNTQFQTGFVHTGGELVLRCAPVPVGLVCECLGKGDLWLPEIKTSQIGHFCVVMEGKQSTRCCHCGVALGVLVQGMGRLRAGV